MKYITLITLVALAACSNQSTELADALEAERDFHAHQEYLETLYSGESEDE